VFAKFLRLVQNDDVISFPRRRRKKIHRYHVPKEDANYKGGDLLLSLELDHHKRVAGGEIAAALEEIVWNQRSCAEVWTMRKRTRTRTRTTVEDVHSVCSFLCILLVSAGVLMWCWCWKNAGDESLLQLFSDPTAWGTACVVVRTFYYVCKEEEEEEVICLLNCYKILPYLQCYQLMVHVCFRTANDPFTGRFYVYYFRMVKPDKNFNLPITKCNARN